MPVLSLQHWLCFEMCFLLRAQLYFGQNPQLKTAPLKGRPLFSKVILFNHQRNTASLCDVGSPRQCLGRVCPWNLSPTIFQDSYHWNLGETPWDVPFSQCRLDKGGMNPPKYSFRVCLGGKPVLISGLPDSCSLWWLNNKCSVPTLQGLSAPKLQQQLCTPHSPLTLFCSQNSLF